MKKLILASTIVLTSISASAQIANKLVVSANAGPMATIRSSFTSPSGSNVSSPLLRLSPSFGASIQYEASKKILVGLGWQNIHIDQKVVFHNVASTASFTTNYTERNYFANMWYSGYCGYKLGKRHIVYAGLSGAQLQKTSQSFGMHTESIGLSSDTISIERKSNSPVFEKNKIPVLRPYIVYTWQCVKYGKSEILLRFQYNPIAINLPVINTSSQLRVNNVDYDVNHLASGSVRFASYGLQYNYSLR
jgi:hypothetical protein